jgi:AcrR family transcriptional regulator
MAPVTDKARTRTRDPARKEKILAAAASLIARDGFHAVSLMDIGREAGIVGSGIYRHFDNKVSILVALFEGAIDALRVDEQRVIESQHDLSRALDMLVESHVDFVVGQRAIAQVYHHEIASLPHDDRRRLRRKQRLYVNDWAHVVRRRRPELDDDAARVLVHAAISAIQSTLFHTAGLADERLRHLLAVSAHAVLYVEVPSET